MLLALAGLVFANADQLKRFVSTDENTDLTSVLPYVLALVAAVTWAVYSALLARWRTWAKDFLTSPIGFLTIGLSSCVILSVTKPNGAALNSSGLLLTLLYGAGPLAAGYLLWELALSKAKVQSLSLIAAATPVLSTLLLCGFLKKAPAPNLILAALFVSGGVVLSLGD
jgi:drug/metabolite transporter (DMT)-like permease